MCNNFYFELYHTYWVKIYWITKCTTGYSFPLSLPSQKMWEEEKENELTKPGLNKDFLVVN